VTRPRDLGFRVESFPTRTRTLPPATHTNSYALGGREVLIVEPAPHDEAEQRAMIAWVEGMRAEGRRPVAIVVTHHHQDHVGAATTLQRELGLALWGHEATQAKMPGVRFDRTLVDGDRLELEGPTQRWEVLHTPGHAPGHVCLHEATLGLLVLGDMIATRGTILVAPGDGDMRVYLEQLERLGRLEARIGLPAHGEPIERPSRVLRATHAHRLMREGKVVRALRAAGGVVRVDELLAYVYDDTPVAVWPLARLSLLSHLEKLVSEGRVREDGREQFGLAEEGSR
jgi:glyoxylase-like metal-dependent hydrolase (beta-lactamase superfamily II)